MASPITKTEKRSLQPRTKKGDVQKCGFISSHRHFTLLSFGSGFKIQGSRGGFAAIIYGAMPDQESFSPLPLEGADERSEAGLASPHVKIAHREPTSAPSGHLLPKEGGRKVECVDWYLGLKAEVAASPRIYMGDARRSEDRSQMSDVS